MNFKAPLLTSGFPSQRASNPGSISMSRNHHYTCFLQTLVVYIFDEQKKLLLRYQVIGTLSLTESPKCSKQFNTSKLCCWCPFCYIIQGDTRCMYTRTHRGHHWSSLFSYSPPKHHLGRLLTLQIYSLRRRHRQNHKHRMCHVWSHAHHL